MEVGVKAVDHPSEFGHGATERHSEHGQDWLTCRDCGATWSIVVCGIVDRPMDRDEDADYYGLEDDEWEDYERIDEGDGYCEEHYEEHYDEYTDY